ncbi:MAG: hypothetical protein FJ029_16195 [Actinobacteria bacterium]|nr:hypothetical protein [Actinomycetota bacterium]
MAFTNVTPDVDSGAQVFASAVVGFEASLAPPLKQVQGYLESTVARAPATLAGQFIGFEFVAGAVDRGGRAPMAVLEFRFRTSTGAQVRALRAIVPGRARVFVVAFSTLDAAWPA